MTTDDRPSIAELQGTMLPLVRHPDWIEQAAWADARDSIVDAAPVLLEIAATGIAWSAAEDALTEARSTSDRVAASMRATSAFDKHRVALSKVRP